MLVVCLSGQQALKLKDPVARKALAGMHLGGQSHMYFGEAVAHLIGGGRRPVQAAGSHENIFFQEVAAPYDADKRKDGLAFPVGIKSR